MRLSPCGFQFYGLSVYFHSLSQGTFLPLLQVAHQAEPCTTVALDKVLLVFHRAGGFQNENLYQCPGLLAETQAGLYHLGVVEHHQCALGQIRGQMVETAFLHLSAVVHQKLAAVALRQGEFGNALVGQGVIIILDLNMLGVHRSQICAKIHHSREKCVILSAKQGITDENRR